MKSVQSQVVVKQGNILVLFFPSFSLWLKLLRMREGNIGCRQLKRVDYRVMPLLDDLLIAAEPPIPEKNLQFNINVLVKLAANEC